MPFGQDNENDCNSGRKEAEEGEGKDKEVEERENRGLNWMDVCGLMYSSGKPPEMTIISTLQMGKLWLRKVR